MRKLVKEGGIYFPKRITCADTCKCHNCNDGGPVKNDSKFQSFLQVSDKRFLQKISQKPREGKVG